MNKKNGRCLFRGSKHLDALPYILDNPCTGIACPPAKSSHPGRYALYKSLQLPSKTAKGFHTKLPSLSRRSYTFYRPASRHTKPVPVLRTCRSKWPGRAEQRASSQSLWPSEGENGWSGAASASAAGRPP